MIMANEKRVLALKVLCLYIKTVCGITLTTQYNKFADAIIKRCGKQISPKNVENIISGTQNFFTFEQACVVAESCATIAKGKDKLGSLTYHLELFLKQCVPDDTIDVKNLVRKYTGKTNENPHEENKLTQNKSTNNTLSHNGQIPIQDIVAKNIRAAIQNENRFVFLFGPDNSGKSFNAKSAINEYFAEGKLDFKVTLDYEYDKMTYTEFLKKVIKAECENPRYASLNDVPELKRKAAKTFCGKKFGIFINGLERFETENDRESTLVFLQNSVLPQGNVVIVTSSLPKDSYPYITNSFREIPMPRLGLKEWLLHVSKIRNETPFLQRLDEQTFNKIVNLSFLHCEGSLGLASRLLFCFADLSSNDDLSDFDFNAEASVLLFAEEFKNLSEENLTLLVTMSLFDICTKKGLSEVTGYSESLLEECLDSLKKRSYIKTVKSNTETTLYVLTNKVRLTLERERQNNVEKYKNIFENWLLYYTKLTENIDVTADNYNNFCRTLPELKNILMAIEYAAENGYRNEYVTLAKNWLGHAKAS